jgi:hypothetical protein
MQFGCPARCAPRSIAHVVRHFLIAPLAKVQGLNLGYKESDINIQPNRCGRNAVSGWAQELQQNTCRGRRIIWRRQCLHGICESTMLRPGVAAHAMQASRYDVPNFLAPPASRARALVSFLIPCRIHTKPLLNSNERK